VKHYDKHDKISTCVVSRQTSRLTSVNISRYMHANILLNIQGHLVELIALMLSQVLPGQGSGKFGNSEDRCCYVHQEETQFWKCLVAMCSFPITISSSRRPSSFRICANHPHQDQFISSLKNIIAIPPDCKLRRPTRLVVDMIRINPYASNLTAPRTAHLSSFAHFKNVPKYRV
jgi:hypothetical protein